MRMPVFGIKQNMKTTFMVAILATVQTRPYEWPQIQCAEHFQGLPHVIIIGLDLAVVPRESMPYVS